MPFNYYLFHCQNGNVFLPHEISIRTVAVGNCFRWDRVVQTDEISYSIRVDRLLNFCQLNQLGLLLPVSWIGCALFDPPDSGSTRCTAIVYEVPKNSEWPLEPLWPNLHDCYGVNVRESFVDGVGIEIDWLTVSIINIYNSDQLNIRWASDYNSCQVRLRERTRMETVIFNFIEMVNDGWNELLSNQQQFRFDN